MDSPFLLSDLCAICPPDYPEDDLIAIAAGTTALEFEPLRYQAQFLNSESRRSAMIGGLGIGKTQCGAIRAYHVGVLANPEPHVGLVLAPTYPMLRDVTIPKLAEVFPPEVLAGGSWATGWHGTEKVVRLATGTMVLCRSMDGTAFNRVRGVQAAWAWGDELGLIRTEEPWDVVTGRLRGRARYRAAWATMTPKGMNWAADRWILNPKPGHEYVHATAYDNPYLPKDYLADLEASYSETFIRQELMGEVVSMQGATYAELSEAHWPEGNVLVYQADTSRHVELWIDFGYRNPRVLAVQEAQALDHEGRSRKVDAVVWELQGKNGKPPTSLKVDEWLDTIQEAGLRVSKVYGDPAGDSQNDQTHVSSAQKVANRLRCPFLKPTKDWQRSKERGEETVRSQIRAADGTRTLVWAAKNEKDRRGVFKLWAPNSFRAFRNLQYPEPKPGQPAKNESLKDGVNDHDTDAARYGLVMKYGRERVVRPWEVLRGLG